MLSLKSGSAYALALFGMLAGPLVSCTTDGGIGLVGKAEFKGDGAVWSDGQVTVVIGNGSAQMGVYGKATGFPFIVPVPAEVEPGMVWAFNTETGDEIHQEIIKPLPLWAMTVFLPGEAEKYGLTFE